MKTITETLQALRDAVELKGEDYIDPNSAGVFGCVYSNKDGTPACIVGHVLHAWGAPLTNLPGDVYEILMAAQTEQDQGKTWGDALAAAEAEAGRYE